MLQTPTHPDGQGTAGWYDDIDEVVKPLGHKVTPRAFETYIVPGSATTCTRCEEKIVLVTHRAGDLGEYCLTESPHWWTCGPTPAKPLQQHKPAEYPRPTE